MCELALCICHKILVTLVYKENLHWFMVLALSVHNRSVLLLQACREVVHHGGAAGHSKLTPSRLRLMIPWKGMTSMTQISPDPTS